MSKLGQWRGEGSQKWKEDGRRLVAGKGKVLCTVEFVGVSGEWRELYGYRVDSRYVR